MKHVKLLLAFMAGALVAIVVMFVIDQQKAKYWENNTILYACKADNQETYFIRSFDAENQEQYLEFLNSNADQIDPIGLLSGDAIDYSRCSIVPTRIVDAPKPNVEDLLKVPDYSEYEF